MLELGKNGNGFPIEVKGLQKSFGEQKVLKSISLKVQRGETVSVLGKSGSGKSVLLKLIIRLQDSDSGSIRVAGTDIAEANVEKLNEVRKKIGFLFQRAALYDSLTVEENVAFPLRRHASLQGEELRRRVQQLLADVDMEQEQRKMPAELSGGMQKRVGLARALALKPEILLLDEPTAGLDPITAAEIVDLILELKRRHSMSAVVVTHDVLSARAFSNRLVLLQDGTIRAEGTFDELKQERDPFVAQFLDQQEARR